MPYLFKLIIGLLMLAYVLPLGISNTQAATVSELLDAMKQRQQSIQDYDFVVSTSNFLEGKDQETVDELVQKMQERFHKLNTSPSVDQLEKRAIQTELIRLLQERAMLTGTIFHYRGIGTKTRSYAVALIPDVKNVLATIYSNSSPEEQTDEALANILETDVYEPMTQFVNHNVVLPNMTMRAITPYIIPGREEIPKGFYSDAKREDEALFECPEYSTVSIESTLQNSSRSSWFPFWHEEVLNHATEDNTQIVSENDDEIELLITAEDTSRKLSFQVFCTPDGRINRFIKKADGKVIAKANYSHFVAINDEIELPQTGSMWTPMRDLGAGATQSESNRICTLLTGNINLGVTVDDLYMEVPENTTILDHRGNGETRIVTTQPVRLGASLPENIGQLLKSE